jgi:hypothetical protein
MPFGEINYVGANGSLASFSTFSTSSYRNNIYRYSLADADFLTLGIFVKQAW